MPNIPYFVLAMPTELLRILQDSSVISKQRSLYPPAAKVTIIKTESKIPGVSSVTNINRSWADIIVTFQLCLTLQ
nr:hypothetical protein [Nostoc sp. DedQUE01]